MTLVYKSPKLLTPPPADTPGPGAYSFIQPDNKPNHPSACFLSKCKRDAPAPPCDLRVGPGSYNLAEEEPEQLDAAQSVFRSKIKRFPPEKQNKTHNHVDLQLGASKASGEEGHDSKIPGKIIGINERKLIEKELMPQMLPSIPSQDCSYGYRFDSNSNKLVQNDNPKIIFTKSLQPGKQDFYFQRVPTSFSKGQQCLLQSKVKRSSPELVHQIGLPSPGQYNPKCQVIVNNSGVGKINAFASQQGRFQQPCSPKELLRLRKLKRDFKDYCGGMDIKELQEIKMKIHDQKGQEKSKSQQQKECFLSKQDRFKNQPQINRQEAKLHSPIDAVQNDDKPKIGKKQPYALGEERFRQKGKQNLGPGSYQILHKQSIAVSLNQKQERFKAVAAKQKFPGPGSYNAHLKTETQKVKLPFNRFVCTHLKDRENNRATSMESLYQQVGKQLNYQSKIQKIVDRTKRVSPDKSKRQFMTEKAGLARIKQLLKDQKQSKSSNKFN